MPEGDHGRRGFQRLSKGRHTTGSATPSGARPQARPDDAATRPQAPGARPQLRADAGWTRLAPSGIRPGDRRNRAGRRLRWAITLAVIVLAGVGAGLAIGLRGDSPDPALTATAQNQTPRGAAELAWSEAILTKLGDPLTAANIVSMGYWMQNEAGTPPSGIVGANNPINVSQPGYGGTPIKSEGPDYSLYSYPTPRDGIDATVTYLNRPSYAGILAALKAGRGLSSSSLAAEFFTYSGGGYDSVPDHWGASQGKPQT
jgi:hypothetical protein